MKLSSRCIVKTPLEASDIGKVSPRIYCDFTLKRTSGDGGYFSHSILNSFPEVPKRVEFLNKFYQCLLYGQLPHKAKKLVVCGANNSGKCSWARIIFGLMNRSKIISVTKEKTFDFSMVDEDTELISIDEWSENTLNISNVKTLFQGSWMVKLVKHQDAQTFDNKAGVYLTCNELRDSGVEQPNVDRRISVFHTTELMEPKSEAPQWNEDNLMECLIWMINEINRNIKDVSQQEIFYEKPFNEATKKCKNRNFPPEELEKLRSVCVDGAHIGLQDPREVNNTAHLSSETVASSINRRDSGMEWIYNLTREGNNLNRLSCINMVINVFLLLFKKVHKLCYFSKALYLWYQDIFFI